MQIVIAFAFVLQKNYGGKLIDLSDGKIHNGTTFVFRLFSPSAASGIGENGLIATSTSIEPLFLGAFAPIIL
jgi:hypothetical protein